MRVWRAFRAANDSRGPTHRLQTMRILSIGRTAMNSSGRILGSMQALNSLETRENERSTEPDYLCLTYVVERVGAAAALELRSRTEPHARHSAHMYRNGK